MEALPEIIPMYDCLDLVSQKFSDSKICVLDKGFVRLVDAMPRLVPEGQTGDYAIAQMARVSYGQGTKTVSDDTGLIRYLMRHAHSSPLESIEFKFHIKAPLFVVQQLLRHRTANINQCSHRYSEVEDDFYVPAEDNVRVQSKSNKQGGEELADEKLTKEFRELLEDHSSMTYETYKTFLEQGVSREQARAFLPVNTYTQLYWKCDLKNLLHFLALRADSHAQQEIRVYADAILNLIKPVVPVTVAAWEDYHPMRGALMLTRLEVEALQKSLKSNVFTEIDSVNKREKGEWVTKYQKLFNLENNNE